jgi:ubiquinone/menaquinone biosynthesis C-methylase UbiE
MTNHSLSFDRAADIYDQTRGHPPIVSEQVADSLIAVLNPSPRLLEIGIGTGRIASPIAARGIEVTGLDISAKMMRRLLDNLPTDRTRLNLIQADATQCPLRSGIFDAVLAVHVLHLIPT